MTCRQVLAGARCYPLRWALVLLVHVSLLLGFDKHSLVTGAENRLALEENERAITVTREGKAVLVYNKLSPPVPDGVDPVYGRSGFLHPVCSPAGTVVTSVFPADHPHQQGIFSAWVRTRWRDREIDFWNLAGKTGRVLHHRVLSTFQDDHGVGFSVELLHRAVKPTEVDILRETWKVRVLPTDGDFHCFDLESEQQALTDSSLLVMKYHYGGFAVRGPMSWLERGDSGWSDELGPNSGSRFLNDRGSDRESGNHEHARWVSMFPRDEDQMASITMLCHPSNRNAPQAARLHPTKPYFCFAPCVDHEFTIESGKPLVSRYRFIVTDARPDPAWLDEQYRAFASE